MLIVETTASLAAIPDRSDTAACHVPNPRGFRKGAITEPKAANILSELFFCEFEWRWKILKDPY